MTPRCDQTATNKDVPTQGDECNFRTTASGSDLTLDVPQIDLASFYCLGAVRSW